MAHGGWDSWDSGSGGGRQPNEDAWASWSTANKEWSDDSWAGWGKQHGSGGGAKKWDAWDGGGNSWDDWKGSGGQAGGGKWDKWGGGNSWKNGDAQDWNSGDVQEGGASGSAQGGGWGSGWNSGEGTWDAWANMGDKLDRSIDWNSLTLVAIEKNFYEEHADVAARSDKEVEEIRKRFDIEVLGGGGTVPKPVTSFEEASLPDWLLQAIYKKGFQQPFPIQVQVWPVALQGRDLIGIAETGSGKTLAYLLPMMVHIIAQEELKANEGPVGIVMCPTRELAIQIDGVAKELFGVSGLRSACVYGGTSVKEQGRALMEKNDIVIATPGRLIQLLNEGWTNLNRATYVVLDEADEMLNQGFGDQMRLILSQVRPDRQMLMFSATWPKEVQVLANEFCTADADLEPVLVRIGGDHLAACRTISQHVLVLDKWADKFEKLREAVCRSGCDARGNVNKCLVFCKTKVGVDELVGRFTQQQIEALGIHGDKRQEERLWALNQFKDGDVSCLVATNCLGRGHDIPRVKYVVNYDAPTTIESYIHRIGRTGRAGEQGFALTFVTDRDIKLVPPLIEVLQQTKQPVDQKLRDLADYAASVEEHAYRVGAGSAWTQETNEGGEP